MITVTDLFCGAGGSSSGLASLPHVKVVIAANHWKLAIDSHQANHPNTDHTSADISQVEPSWFPTTDILWASPECTNHSVAKGVKRQRAVNEALFELNGTKPLDDDAANRSRATMWDVPRFAEYHHYKAIIIENVVDAYRWVPFPAWLMAMEALGYSHEIVWLNSMHAQALGMPAPQSRDRMYVVFWLKGNRKPDLQKWTRPRALCNVHGVITAVQVMKKAEAWGRYKAQYVYRCPKCASVVEPGWLPASSAIDWSIEGTRIGDREKPLSPKTMTRIQKGIDRYWKPIVVAAAGNTYDGVTTGSEYIRAWPTSEPLPVQQTSAQHGVALPPFLAQFRERERTLDPAREVLPTVVADGGNHALVMNNVSGADVSRTKRASDPLPTLVGGGLHASLLVPVEGRDGKSAAPGSDPFRTQSTRNETAIVVPLRNHGVAKSAADPIDTVSDGGNHHALVVTNNHSNRSRSIIETLPTATTATTQALLMRNNEGGAEMSTPVHEVMRTLTTGGHQSLLNGPVVDVEDCIFRMLEPHEIKVGMAFASDYILLGNKREQVKQAGNAVTPPAARDLGAAVIESLGVQIEMGWAA